MYSSVDLQTRAKCDSRGYVQTGLVFITLLDRPRNVKRDNVSFHIFLEANKLGKILCHQSQFSFFCFVGLVLYF